MTELVHSSPMPDEPIWGHYRRMLWLNRGEPLRTAVWRVKNSLVDNHDQRSSYHHACVVLLAGSSDAAVLKRYFLRHSLYSQLLSPFMLAFLSWHSLLGRWHQHFVRYASSRRVWRSCSKCAAHDVANNGFAWFKRVHQYPGVEWCLHHGTRLSEIPEYRHFIDSEKQADWYRPSQRSKRSNNSAPTPFVERYLAAMKWLNQAENRADWHILEREAKGRFDLRAERGPGDQLIETRIKTLAPRAWLQRAFSGKLGVSIERSTSFALVAAAATDSARDLRQMLKSTSSYGRRERSALLPTTDKQDLEYLRPPLRSYDAWLTEERERI